MSDHHQNLRHPTKFFLILGSLTSVIVTLLISSVFQASWYLLWLASLSLVTVVFFGYDKMAAKRSWQRIPEIALHALSLGGGFLGGLVGRKIFRHKTLRASFLWVPLSGAVLHVAILAIF